MTTRAQLRLEHINRVALKHNLDPIELFAAAEAVWDTLKPWGFLFDPSVEAATAALVAARNAADRQAQERES